MQKSNQAKINTNANTNSNVTLVDTANSPLVKPTEVHGANTASEGRTTQDWAARALEANSESLAAKAVVKSRCAAAVSNYFEAVEATTNDTTLGHQAEAVVEEAKQDVARAYCDAILQNVYSRSDMRAQLGADFGFEMSPKTLKPTSKPLEPGNTIAKRVASVSIAAEYAISGELPDRGGDSLPLVGQYELEELLSDYFSGEITVRAASERIEKAIRDARVSTPLEMDADKIIRLAGKIETASTAIAKNLSLREAYTALFQVIASIPFPADTAKAA